MEIKAPRVRLDPWSEGDLDLLRGMNAPELMTHLGGPETEEQVLKRHRRYVELSADRTGKGRMFRVVLLPEDGGPENGGPENGEGEDGEGERPVGTVGFWEQTWNGEAVYESGWGVLAAYHGRGIAPAATRAVVDEARAARKHRFLHAFPSVDNGPSNAVCRKAGFTLRGEADFEYPVGHPMRCNNWRLDLTTLPGSVVSAQ